MSDKQTSEITQILQDWNDGETDAKERLLPFVYDELRRLAKGQATFTEAVSCLLLPDGFDGRLFGPMVAQLRRDRVIEPVGFAPSKNTDCHSRLCRLVDQSKGVKS